MIRRVPLTCQECESSTLSYVVRRKDGAVDAIKYTNFTYTLKSLGNPENSFEGWLQHKYQSERCVSPRKVLHVRIDLKRVGAAYPV
ncbi:hypothetical protein KFL_010970020 [Klebsormidium nitens]|uniref:Uncharacterized protein n=1 Tax=Klebsormidium nitens TaxID=105231 RepID=A0A1Y1IPR3_KLENI|nr:hypothetical protein KFL_010970020 [Klebsormidium nitens]|eukprot:GAQ92694.1 hypothetical protein KFL_010970020 [Klebsormidium nitens]